MNIRVLKQSDIPFVFEFLKEDAIRGIFDPGDLIQHMGVEHLVDNSEASLDMRCYAVISQEEEFQGIVALRHVDVLNGTAEFLIAVLPNARGKGYAWFAMRKMLHLAFEQFGLNSVYFCVASDNGRAVRFFQKHGFNHLDEDVPREIKERHKEEELLWFACLKGDDYENKALSRGEIAGCKILRIKTIPTIEAGELSFFEGNRDVEFDIKRIYYISKVPEGRRRGFHAHKKLKQMLFCPYGEIQLLLDNGESRGEITLSDPSIGVLIDKPTWREMLWIKADSVLVVSVSDYYSEHDYIRDYEQFIRYIRQ